MILLVAVSAMATVGAAPINWCNNVETADEQEMAKLITKTMPYLKSACYFVVERGLEGALIGSSEFRRFQIQNARETCKKFGASLPSVQSADENKFLSQIGKYVVLGLQVSEKNKDAAKISHIFAIAAVHVPRGSSRKRLLDTNVSCCRRSCLITSRSR